MLKVLRSIDYDKTYIHCLTVEDNYGSKEERNFLLKKGYRLWKKISWDNVFIHHSNESRGVRFLVNLLDSVRNLRS